MKLTEKEKEVINEALENYIEHLSLYGLVKEIEVAEVVLEKLKG